MTKTPNPARHLEFIVERDASAAPTNNGRARITTESVDRMGDVVVAAGMDAKHYMKNPVVLWGHDNHSLPIGKTIRLDVIPGKGVDAEWEWAPTPEAQKVKQLWDLGFLNATSIGFQPDMSKAEEMEGDDSWFPPLKFHAWSLLEYSICNVPANPEALARRALKEYDQGETDLLSTLIDVGLLAPVVKMLAPFVSKSGRVLSAANELKLSQARDMIDSVLAQLQAADDDEGKSIGVPDALYLEVDETSTSALDNADPAVYDSDTTEPADAITSPDDAASNALETSVLAAVDDAISSLISALLGKAI